ncbi:ROK family protein [Streptomyces sp. NA04227]|uniref:ROK family protein n=1 Tax=Streptomyces sp. NA04227 TaxID=2742136 RepID=UPI0015910426|nr:ROK family protein [Streptomyces sp. NA04227]QKW10452.1 ROK family protein [Streptomyces sp. NA04227]
MSVIALDVSANRISGEVFAGRGRVLASLREPVRNDYGPDDVLDAVLDCADRLAAEARREGSPAVAAGIVVPGLVDEEHGISCYAAHLGWRELPVGEWLAEHLGLPVAVGHDVRAAAKAESRLGAGRGCDGFAYVPVGTGVAAAVVLGGSPLASGGGGVGEIGHLIVRPGGAECVCGSQGCLETMASASAIAGRYMRVTGERGITAQEVHRRASAGDTEAAEVWQEALEALADGLAALTRVLDFDRIVLGGELLEAGSSFFAPLRGALAERLTFRRPPKLTAARLGERAGCLGAALLAEELVAVA